MNPLPEPTFKVPSAQREKKESASGKENAAIALRRPPLPRGQYPPAPAPRLPFFHLGLPSVPPEMADAIHWLSRLSVMNPPSISDRPPVFLQTFTANHVAHKLGSQYNFHPQHIALGFYWGSLVVSKWAHTQLAVLNDYSRPLLVRAIFLCCINLAAEMAGDKFYSIKAIMELSFQKKFEPEEVLGFQLSLLDALEWRLIPGLLLSVEEVEAIKRDEGRG